MTHLTVERLTREVDEMLASVHEANADFDHLLNEIPAGDFRDTLGAHLDYMRTRLDILATDLRTLPLASSLPVREEK